MRNLVILVSFLFVLVDSQRKCKTPTNVDGTCIPLSKCKVIQPIIAAARLRNETALKLVIAYQCGYQVEPLVCCDVLDRDAIFTTPKPRVGIRKPIVLKDFNSTELPDRTVCGVSRQSDDRIWGGQQTELDEFPWAAALEYVKKTDNSNAGIRCGGSLINHQYVITAAHCISNTEFKIIKVRLGEWNLDTNPDCYELDLPNPECADRVQIFDVEKVIPHEYYSMRDSSNDIGLLKLNRAVSYTDFIRPVCLPPPGLPYVELGTYMTVVGWGLTEKDVASNIKLKVDVPLVSNRVCREKLPSKLISSNHYCAGGEYGIDACRGDSGGPLMRTFSNTLDGEDQWFLEGIVGSGAGCGRLGKPAIYIRVTQYTKWIIDNLVEERKKTTGTRTQTLGISKY